MLPCRHNSSSDSVAVTPCSNRVILPLWALFPHFDPLGPFPSEPIVMIWPSEDSLYPFCFELPRSPPPDPYEGPPATRVQSALRLGKLTAMIANCISSAATITIFPSTHDVSGELFSSMRGMSRKHAIMTELLPKAMTPSTAALRRTDIWSFKTVCMGRMRM
jgi:hypothetical protein